MSLLVMKVKEEDRDILFEHTYVIGLPEDEDSFEEIIESYQDTEDIKNDYSYEVIEGYGNEFLVSTRLVKGL